MCIRSSRNGLQQLWQVGVFQWYFFWVELVLLAGLGEEHRLRPPGPEQARAQLEQAGLGLGLGPVGQAVPPMHMAFLRTAPIQVVTQVEALKPAGDHLLGQPLNLHLALGTNHTRMDSQMEVLRLNQLENLRHSLGISLDILNRHLSPTINTPNLPLSLSIDLDMLKRHLNPNHNILNLLLSLGIRLSTPKLRPSLSITMLNLLVSRRPHRPLKLRNPRLNINHGLHPSLLLNPPRNLHLKLRLSLSPCHNLHHNLHLNLHLNLHPNLPLNLQLNLQLKSPLSRNLSLPHNQILKIPHQQRSRLFPKSPLNLIVKLNLRPLLRLLLKHILNPLNLHLSLLLSSILSPLPKIIRHLLPLKNHKPLRRVILNLPQRQLPLPSHEPRLLRQHSNLHKLVAPNHELNLDPRGSAPDQLLLRNLGLFPIRTGKELKFQPLSRGPLPNLHGSERLRDL